MPALIATALPSCPLSYPAGGTSIAPDRFRIVGAEPTKWIHRLVSCFPAVTDFFGPQSLVISAYPATLGLNGFCPSVDTYLHPPTFFSALQLAALENRCVLLAAQPLVGADLLLRATREHILLPKRILWGVGGYYFPASLEAFIRSRLEEHGVELRFLYSYGMAEVGHSLLCATERLPSADPAFRQIADQIQLKSDKSSRLIIINQDGTVFSTDDIAELRNCCWRIRSSPKRLDPRVRDQLEGWGCREWERRTGYLHASDAGFKLQLRETVPSTSSDEHCYHLFWHQFGGSITMKPKWNWQQP